MRQNQNASSSTSYRSLRSKKAAFSAIAFLIVSCFAAKSDLSARNHSNANSECELAGPVRDYRGKIQSIAMWEDRNPRQASNLREIATLSVFEMTRFFERSPEFQAILEKLESDRLDYNIYRPHSSLGYRPPPGCAQRAKPTTTNTVSNQPKLTLQVD